MIEKVSFFHEIAVQMIPNEDERGLRRIE